MIASGRPLKGGFARLAVFSVLHCPPTDLQGHKADSAPLTHPAQRLGDANCRCETRSFVLNDTKSFKRVRGQPTDSRQTRREGGALVQTPLWRFAFT